MIISLLLIGCGSVASRASTAASSPQPVLSLSTTAFNFNTVVVGQSATQTLQIINSGAAPLTINSLSLQSQQFSITGPSAPRTILPGQNVTYTVSFVPTTAGGFSASVEIATNASSAPAGVSLAGIAETAYAALLISPTILDFGDLKLQATGTQTVTIQNTGDINTTINGVTLAGAGFGFSNLSPGVTLSPNQTISFQVWFRPQVLGAASGTVSILSSNVSSPPGITITGEGVSPTAPAVQHSVSLSWVASTSASITGYRVYRSTLSDAGYSALTSTLSALSYTDKTVVSGTIYYYSVTAVDSSGFESPYSNPVIAIVP